MKKLSGLMQSKTFWVNALMFILVLIPRIADLPGLTIPAETTGFIIFVVNAILRWVTKTPLEDK